MAETYVLRYLVNSYRLADAFRPSPGWGSKTFTVNAADLPPHSDDEVVDSAKGMTPDGYWLQRVTAIGNGERELFFKPVSVAPNPINAGRTSNS